MVLTNAHSISTRLKKRVAFRMGDIITSRMIMKTQPTSLAINAHSPGPNSMRKAVDEAGGTKVGFLTKILERYWIGVPAFARRFSVILSAICSDGLYLTAQPVVATALPLVIFLFGLFEGSTHFSILTLNNDQLTHFDLAPTFAQNVILVLVAAAVGSFSANLGLILVLGFAIGDFTIAGLLGLNPDNASGFIYLRVPQLISYSLFLMLAVLPTLSSSSLLSGVLSRLRGRGALRTQLRVIPLAVVQGLIVCFWILAAPMVFRIFWFWQGGGSPVTVPYYQQVMMPLVPGIAAVAILLRSWLMTRSYRNRDVVTRLATLTTSIRVSDEHPGFTRRLPSWLWALIYAAFVTLFLSGMITSLGAGVLVFLIITAILVGRLIFLPKVEIWATLCRVLEHIPIAVRLAVALVVSFMVACVVLALPGQSPADTTQFGDFHAELAAIVLGLLISVILLGGQPTRARAPELKVPLGAAGTLAIGISLMMALLPVKSYADCEDPSCCFGGNTLLAALAILSLIALLALGIFVLAPMFAEMMTAGLVAASEAADAALIAAVEAGASPLEIAAAGMSDASLETAAAGLEASLGELGSAAELGSLGDVAAAEEAAAEGLADTFVPGAVPDTLVPEAEAAGEEGASAAESFEDEE
jgi:hypothetical protein